MTAAVRYESTSCAVISDPALHLRKSSNSGNVIPSRSDCARTLTGCTVRTDTTQSR